MATKQKQMPVPQVQTELPAPAFVKTEVVLPESTLDKVDAALKKSQVSTCCGLLPCKGKTLACFDCDVCLECITGSHCPHDQAVHEPHRFDAAVLEELNDA